MVFQDNNVTCKIESSNVYKYVQIGEKLSPLTPHGRQILVSGIAIIFIPSSPFHSDALSICVHQ